MLTNCSSFISLSSISLHFFRFQFVCKVYCDAINSESEYSIRVCSDDDASCCTIISEISGFFSFLLRFAIFLRKGKCNFLLLLIANLSFFFLLLAAALQSISIMHAKRKNVFFLSIAIKLLNVLLPMRVWKVNSFLKETLF